MSTSKLDIHGFVHQDIIYENDQQDATVYDNLLFIFKFNIHGTVHRSLTSSNNQRDAA